MMLNKVGVCLPFYQYYNHMTNINDDSSIISKFVASLTDDARVVSYDRHVFIAQATGVSNKPS
jgi:hypothetical protein